MHRNLSDIDLSTAVHDGLASALFSASKNPHRIPANTLPVFRSLRSRICLPLLRLVTTGNVGQAPGVYAMFGWLCLLAVISLQSGCITVNLIEPSGPVQEVQLSGTGDGKVLLLDLSGVISSQDKDGLVPQPNMLATFKEELT